MYLRPAISSFLAIFLALGVVEACSDDDDKTGTTPGGTDASSPTDAASSDKDSQVSTPPDSSTQPDASNCPGEIKTGNGETCIGYGTGSTCEPSCGQPYGYVCFNGPPPSFTGCREVSKSALVGNSYCCPKNDCVAQPDQNAACGDAGAGKTKRFQCPPGSSAPPAGCVEHNSGGTNLEKFYCCP